MPKRGAAFGKRMGKADYKGSARSRKKAGEEREKGGRKARKRQEKGQNREIYEKIMI